MKEIEIALQQFNIEYNEQVQETLKHSQEHILYTLAAIHMDEQLLHINNNTTANNSNNSSKDIVSNENDDDYFTSNHSNNSSSNSKNTSNDWLTQVPTLVNLYRYVYR